MIGVLLALLIGFAIGMGGVGELLRWWRRGPR